MLLVTPSLEGFDNDIYHDIQVIHDVATFNFDNIQQKPDQIWVIAEIVPSFISGALMAPGSYVQSGKFIVPPDTRLIVMIEGSAKRLEILAGNSEKESWEYQWEEKLRYRGRRYFYSPFKNGSVVICHFQKTSDKISKFIQAILIPSEWTEFVLPALQYQQENAELFKDEMTVEKKDKLKNLLYHQNPFIAVAAYRVLAKTSALEVKFLHEYLFSYTGIRQALFIFLFLKHESLEIKTQLVEKMGHTIEHEKIADSLTGLTVGAFAALITFFEVKPFVKSLRKQDFELHRLEILEKRKLKEEMRQFSSQILQSLQRRQDQQDQLEVKSPADKYIDAIVTHAIR